MSSLISSTENVEFVTGSNGCTENDLLERVPRQSRTGPLSSVSQNLFPAREPDHTVILPTRGFEKVRVFGIVILPSKSATFLSQGSSFKQLIALRLQELHCSPSNPIFGNRHEFEVAFVPDADIAT
jgi:hypothetical protein